MATASAAVHALHAHRDAMAADAQREKKAL
jgi:hypothetical protein